MFRLVHRRVLACTFFLFSGLVAVSATAQVDPSLLAGMQARAIGPAGMSGRIGDVAAVPSDPNIMYVGASTGGLWKSIDGGLTWDPIFDDQPVAAIGAVTIDPSNDDVIWVGTGEGNLRNSVSVGNGIYRSRDAGRTWEYLGLEESERIHRIHVSPRDPDTVFVAPSPGNSGATANSAASSARVMAARPGRRSSTSTNGPAAAISRSIRPTPTS